MSVSQADPGINVVLSYLLFKRYSFLNIFIKLNTLSFYRSKIDLTRTNITWLGPKIFGWVKMILDLDQKWLFTIEIAFLTNIQKDSDFALNKRKRKKI